MTLHRLATAAPGFAVAAGAALPAFAAGALDGAAEQQPVNIPAILMFFMFVLGTLGITCRSAKRTKSRWLAARPVRPSRGRPARPVRPSRGRPARPQAVGQPAADRADARPRARPRRRPDEHAHTARRALAAAGALPRDLHEALVEDHAALADLRLRRRLADVRAGRAPGNLIEPRALRPGERERLERLFHDLGRLRRKVPGELLGAAA